MFYVYEWYNVNTEEIFYVGKGCGNRYKQVSKRNQLFKAYYENNECAVRIIQYFDLEQDAFDYEKKRIGELRNINQCFCNVDEGGTGGVNFVWTPEMRAYKSIYNPMKKEKQKERMRKNNPMSDPKVVEQVVSKKSKIVCYNGKEYTCKQLAEATGFQVSTIWKWCQRGYDVNGVPCYYKGEEKDSIKKTTSSKAILVDGQLFPSLRAAADFLGVKDTSPLCKALKANKKYKGHICEYANQQPSEENSSNSILEGSTTNG